MEKVYSGQYFEAMNVKNLLENLNIHVFVENDNMSLIEPFAVSPGEQAPLFLRLINKIIIRLLKLLKHMKMVN